MLLFVKTGLIFFWFLDFSINIVIFTILISPFFFETDSHSIAQDDLELTVVQAPQTSSDPSSSAFLVLRLRACVTTPVDGDLLGYGLPSWQEGKYNF